ncbi:MAG: DUF58 domain-containing protein [Sedimenticolaceae bacterium]|nr:DUF58 domain-containing protein [Sedimenticolaceae bacterium]
MNWYPRRPLLYLASAWLLLGGLASLYPSMTDAWHLAGALFLGITLTDLWRCRQMKTPGVHRLMPRNLPLSVGTHIRLQIRNHQDTPLQFQIHDHYPAHFRCDAMPRTQHLDARSGIEIDYRVSPPERGDARFGKCELQLVSPWRMWQHRRFAGQPESVRVYPNFAEISTYTLLATDNRLSQIGVRRKQRRGMGSEFFQLREFRQGDSQRQIHWQASARQHKLISRDYEDEKDQQVIFLLDTGRRMRHRDDGRAHLDQALNAVLLLSYVAVRQGDAVGVMTIGGDNRWIPPRKGQDTVNRLLESLYNLESSLQPADYLAAVGRLASLQSRRALVILITNTRNEDERDLFAATRQLRRQHLVVLADLREEILDQTVTRPIDTEDQALRYHAVEGYLDERRRKHLLLMHRGIRALDITARQLPVALVNQYLDIKSEASL